jgi:hypothetical protein
MNSNRFLTWLYLFASIIPLVMICFTNDKVDILAYAAFCLIFILFSNHCSNSEDIDKIKERLLMD